MSGATTVGSAFADVVGEQCRSAADSERVLVGRVVQITNGPVAGSKRSQRRGVKRVFVMRIDRPDATPTRANVTAPGPLAATVETLSKGDLVSIRGIVQRPPDDDRRLRDVERVLARSIEKIEEEP